MGWRRRTERRPWSEVAACMCKKQHYPYFRISDGDTVQYLYYYDLLRNTFKIGKFILWENVQLCCKAYSHWGA